MSPRGSVWLAAAAAALLRFPGLFWPLRSDEAGYLLVARSWHPQPDSMFGRYWVDRSPELIGLIKLSDWVGGAYFLRWVAAAGCVLLVLGAAVFARTVVRLHEGDQRSADRTAMWTAWLAALTVSSFAIDPISAKGEILGIPLVMWSLVLTLRSLERRAVAPAFASGLLAMLAVGLKQNMVAGLVFAVALLIGCVIKRRLSGPDFTRLIAAVAAGAAVPVLATVAWALAAGVDLRTVTYALFTFRGEAADVIASVESDTNEERAWIFVLIAVGSGIALVLLWFLLHLRALLRRSPALTTAALITGAVDVTGTVLGGSFWGAYAFVLIPGVVVCASLVLELQDAQRSARGQRPVPGFEARALIGAIAVATTVAAAVTLGAGASGAFPPTRTNVGRAIGAAAEPGDSLVVYGGRADIQLASGLSSPYPYLWSLPMRVLDPDLADLRRMLAGPNAPDWVLVWVPMDDWEGLGGRDIAPVISVRYSFHGDLCGDNQLYLRNDLERPPVVPDCDAGGL